VSLTDGFFLNTSVKTSILYFKKDGHRTQDVIFSQIHLENDQIIEDNRVHISYHQIKENSYNLHVNRYNCTKISTIEGLTYDTFEHIFDMVKGKEKSSQVIDDVTGCYKMITLSQNILDYKSIPVHRFDGQCLFIGNIDTGKKFCIRYYDGKCDCTNLLSFCQTKEGYKNKINSKFYYYYLLTLQDLLTKEYLKGSCNLSLDKEKFSQLQLPVPSMVIQAAIVERLDTLSHNIELSYQMIKDYHQIIKYHIECQTINEKETVLGDVCTIKTGIFTAKDRQETGQYPFYSSDVNSPVGFCDDYCFDYDKYLILIKDGGAGIGKYGAQIGLGKVFRVSGRTAATSHQTALVIKDASVECDYLYWYMTSIKNDIMNLAQYTTGLGCIRRNDLCQLVIKCPSLAKQREIVGYCENLSRVCICIEQQLSNDQCLMRQVMDSHLKLPVKVVKKISIRVKRQDDE
jgi:restriction endonuclease S subunit